MALFFPFHFFDLISTISVSPGNTPEAYTPDGNAADNEESRLRIFYTTPEDGHTPPIIVPAR